MWILEKSLACGVYILLLICLGILIKWAWGIFKGE